MSKKLSKKEHRKHVHHVIAYLSLITAAILTVVVSVFTLTKVNECSSKELYPNTNDLALRCSVEKKTAYGWPLQQIDGESLAPTIANFGFYFLLVFGLVKAEAHIKGHIHHDKKR